MFCCVLIPAHTVRTGGISHTGRTCGQVCTFGGGLPCHPRCLFGSEMTKQHMSAIGYCGIYFMPLSYRYQLCLKFLISRIRHSIVAGGASEHLSLSVSYRPIRGTHDRTLAVGALFVIAAPQPRRSYVSLAISSQYMRPRSLSPVPVPFAMCNPCRPLPGVHLFPSAFFPSGLVFPYIHVVYPPLLRRVGNKNPIPTTLPSSPPFH